MPDSTLSGGLVIVLSEPDPSILVRIIMTVICMDRYWPSWPMDPRELGL